MITRSHAVFTLNFVAGWVDAAGFLALAGAVRAFPSFMSGNSTKVVADVVSGDFSLARLVTVVVLAFMAGAFIARLINNGTRRRESAALAGVAGVVWFALAGVLAGWSDYPVLLLLALGMGMINRALQGRDGYTVLTFVTGAIVTIASDIADAISGRGEWRQVLQPLSIWGAILSGAAAGGLLTLNVGLHAGLFIPALIISLLSIVNALGKLEPAEGPQDGHPAGFRQHG
ncbi:YoaK family protein [Croceicoccus sediminis]|uniref:YoaK family protein n=1 Tax=Croceicoccus sediminis TaxID=2571150 RepID=UPI0011840DE4|nr:YoaK family protein [Croceicoccus sediminis]